MNNIFRILFKFTPFESPLKAASKSFRQNTIRLIACPQIRSELTKRPKSDESVFVNFRPNASSNRRDSKTEFVVQFKSYRLTSVRFQFAQPQTFNQRLVEFPVDRWRALDVDGRQRSASISVSCCRHHFAHAAAFTYRLLIPSHPSSVRQHTSPLQLRFNHQLAD